MAQDSAPGAAIYTTLILKLYDFWVLYVSNNWAWRCRTSTTLIPFFNRNLSTHHLDIGVGTGHYLAHANLTPKHEVMLVDLNRNTLEVANKRIGGGARTVLHDVFEPLPKSVTDGAKFDSISLCYLLHCLPGPPDRKAGIFENLKGVLSDEGVLFGSTILGQGVRHNWFGGYLMKVYNKKGLFGNAEDGRKVFEEGLREQFEDVKCWVEGVVLLFEVRRPRREGSLRSRV